MSYEIILVSFPFFPYFELKHFRTSAKNIVAAGVVFFWYCKRRRKDISRPFRKRIIQRLGA